MKSIVWLFSIMPFISFGQISLDLNEGTLKSGKYFPESEFEIKHNFIDSYQAKQGDIIINEVMADPTPVVFLPEYEYLELFNRSDNRLSLDGWELLVGAKTYVLSGSIDPDSYLIITFTGAKSMFARYGDVLGLFTAVAALTNTGQTLILKDSHGEIIDAVQYTDKWYGDNFKAQGGWSLERIDPANICAGKENWAASVSHSGGTPGRENSVKSSNPDTQPPFVSGIQIISGYEINLSFSEPVERSFFSEETPFSLINSSNSITTVYPSSPFYNSCRLTFRDSIRDGMVYEMVIGERFADCSGNKPDQPSVVKFGKPVLSNFTDIILTELL